MVTRAQGKKGNSGKAGATKENPIAFRFDQPVETSKKRRTEERLEAADKGTSATERARRRSIRL